jgi:hypothetical protein
MTTNAATEEGTTAFVGFGIDPAEDPADRSDFCIGKLDRWDGTAFDQAVQPADGSFLRSAVRGFFANGGSECLVLAVSPAAAMTDRVDSLLRVLRNTGPLADREEVGLVCVPDAVSTRLMADPDARYSVQSALLAHCAECTDRFAILDPPEHLPDDRDPVNGLAGMVSKLRSEYGAIYFPWLLDDLSREGASLPTDLHAEQQWRNLESNSKTGSGAASRFETVPPCGHVAGLFARRSGYRGGYRSPANAPLFGVLDTAQSISNARRGVLNEVGVNCIAARRNAGVQVMGGRTLSGLERYRYISAARLMIGLRRWLRQHMSDMVFEPQTPLLWDRIRRRLFGHCLDLWRAGALAEGADEMDAFTVQCDSETNPLGSQERGQVIAKLSLAPSVPAEFIEVQIVHDASGFSVSAA